MMFLHFLDVFLFWAGKPPVVIARGGFSGVFPDSSSKAYEFVSVTTSPNVAVWCDLQLTKDGVGICFPNPNLYNYSDDKDVYPNNKEWFSVDFTWKDLSDVNCKLTTLNPFSNVSIQSF